MYRVLLDWAEAEGIDMVILGHRESKTMVQSMVPGTKKLSSTADQFKARTKCPVLVVRPAVSPPGQVLLVGMGEAGMVQWKGLISATTHDEAPRSVLVMHPAVRPPVWDHWVREAGGKVMGRPGTERPSSTAEQLKARVNCSVSCVCPAFTPPPLMEAGQGDRGRGVGDSGVAQAAAYSPLLQAGLSQCAQTRLHDGSTALLSLAPQRRRAGLAARSSWLRHRLREVP